MLAPGLKDPNLDLAIWPFLGRMAELEWGLVKGFGLSLTGEDHFDPMVGLIGMLQIISGVRYFLEPETE